MLSREFLSSDLLAKPDRISSVFLFWASMMDSFSDIRFSRVWILSCWPPVIFFIVSKALCKAVWSSRNIISSLLSVSISSLFLDNCSCIALASIDLTETASSLSESLPSMMESFSETSASRTWILASWSFVLLFRSTRVRFLTDSTSAKPRSFFSKELFSCMFVLRLNCKASTCAR